MLVISAERIISSLSPVELPLVGVSPSQLVSLLTDQLSAPVPEFQISSTLSGGLAPPSVAVRLKLEGLCAMTGVGGDSATVTVTLSLRIKPSFSAKISKVPLLPIETATVPLAFVI